MMWCPLWILGLLSLTRLTGAQDNDCDHTVVADSGSGSEMRWTYDKSQQTCKLVLQKVSGNGRNIFQTEKECLRQCAPGFDQLYPAGDGVCQLPKDQGPCLALILMWYYDKERQVCDSFFYGACQGNGNRFENKTECTTLCVALKKGKSGASDLAEEPSSSQTDSGLIIGVVFGVVFGAAFLITLGMYLVQRKKLKKQEHKHKRVPDTEMN